MCFQNSLLNQVIYSHFHSSAASSFNFLRFPLGAGSILGVYVTVRVTTSRICLTLVPLFSHRLECPGAGPALVGPGPTSVYLFAFSAASQSKGLLTLLALHGERTRLSTAGLGGTRRLGNVVGPVAGADKGYMPPGDAGFLVEMGAGLEDFGGTFSFMQLQSDATLRLLAEVGTLSRSSSVVLSSDLIVSTVSVLAPVAVRFKVALAGRGAVRGGLTMAGEAGLIVLRKSMYANGGVMGVFSGLSSTFADNMLGVGGYSKGAEGRPAEGRPEAYRPADGSGPLNESAESGVRIEDADKRASPGNATGNVDVVGVLRAGSFGRVVAIVERV